MELNVSRYLYVNGESMTMGFELYNREDTNSQKIADMRQHSWPKYVADHFGVDWTNKALSGGSNDRILRTTIDWVINYINEGKDPGELFVILGMAEITRTELLVNNNDSLVYQRVASRSFEAIKDGELLAYPSYEDKNIQSNSIESEAFADDYINPHLREYVSGYTDVMTFEHLMQKYLFTIHYLKMFFERYDIGYLFFQSECYNFFNKGDIIMSDSLNSRISKKLYDIVIDEHCVNELKLSMYAYCKQNGMPFGPVGHPLHAGHEAWGKYLINYLEEQHLWGNDV